MNPVTNQSHTWREILSQSQTWQSTLAAFSGAQDALGAFLRPSRWDEILVAGCGSTHYLAQTAAMILSQRTGTRAHALPASELWLYPAVLPSKPTMLVAVSRSGTTTETLRAVDRFRENNGGPVLVVTCYPESTLAKLGDFVLAAPDAQEVSVAQTRSFTSMLVLVQALAATLANDAGLLQRLDRLPLSLRDNEVRWQELPRRLGEDANTEQLFFLGGGPFYGLANEAMLKTKEVSLSKAEAYHPMEFRHGPMSMVDEHALVVGFVSDTGQAEDLQVLSEMQGLGARVLAFVEDVSAVSGWKPDHLVELHSGLTEWERGPLLLPFVQRMACHRAQSKGLNPDQPHNLTAVVELPSYEST